MPEPAGMCAVFAGVVLALTAVWVYLLRDRSFQTLALVMYFPGIVAIVMTAADGSIGAFIKQILGVDQVVTSVVYSVMAALTVYVIVWTCVAVAVGCGWATKAEGSGEAAVHQHNKSWLGGLLRAAGEEVGWRCYLLPCLVHTHGWAPAIALSGLVWGLYHMPVMVLLTHRLSPPRPRLTMAVQCLACLLAAFPHSFVAIMSGYSVWASTVMHFVWNQVNPAVLGSIYTNTPGRYKGTQWLINGEGLTGVLVMAPIAVLVTWLLDLTACRGV